MQLNENANRWGFIESLSDEDREVEFKGFQIVPDSLGRLFDYVYADGNRRNIRSRILVCQWLLNRKIFNLYTQKQWAQKHRLNPQAFCRRVALISKLFGITNSRMKPRTGSDHIIRYSRNCRRFTAGRSVVDGINRLRMQTPQKKKASR